jgi:DNA-binding NarL/FixJ family response regulator
MEDVEIAIAVLRRQGASGRPEATVAADRSEALLIAARGDVDVALHRLVNVVEQQASECPFEAARSLLALGRVYRRGGYKRMASDALNQAGATFEKLGTPRWAARARDEAARTGLYPTRSELTTTERRVAEHVASGHSNQETAAALFMSVKTVEANLSRIYRKLSVRSRTELANHMNKLDPALHHE